MQTILAFIFVLGVLIFVHELGHFLAARRIGVRVLTFSLGFGPRLFSFRRGDTDYCISAIPLGGFVKMAGENPDDARSGASDEFLSKSKWQRFQVLIMGPLMNIVLAVAVMTVVLYRERTVPVFESQPVVIGAVVPESPAARSGIRKGDRILAVDGRPAGTWKSFSKELLTKGGRTVSLSIERDAARFDRDVAIEAKGKYGDAHFGGLPLVRAIVGSVTPGSPAAEAGLQPGDAIVGVNGEKTTDSDRIKSLVAAQEGKAVTLDVERNRDVRAVTMTPRPIDGQVRVGVHFSLVGDVTVVSPTLAQAFAFSLERNWEWSTMIGGTLAGLFTRETPVSSLVGPIGIADLTGQATTLGWVSVFTLMALISLNLGLFNLLPVPVLDGGHISILALEGLARHDFSMKAKEKMMLAGFAVLMLLMVTVIYNDLMRLQFVQRLLPWN